MAHPPAVLLVSLVLAAAPTAAQEVAPEPSADGIRVLTHAVVLARSADETWRLFNTEQGMTSWMVPFAHVDLTIGGVIETSYDPSAKAGDPGNIRAEILSLDPGRMTTALGAVPAQFPEAKAEGGLWGVTTYEALDPHHTRVTIRMLGFGEGDEWDQVYAFFQRGNAYYCDMLEQRFGDDGDEQSRAAALLEGLVGRAFPANRHGGPIAFEAGAGGRVVMTSGEGARASVFVLGPDGETGALAAHGFLPDGERFRAAVGERDGALTLDGWTIAGDGSRRLLRIDLELTADGHLVRRWHAEGAVISRQFDAEG